MNFRTGVTTFRSTIGWVCLLCCLLPAVRATSEQKLQARLVWGTDQAKPADPKLRECDPKVKDKLGKTFKWKNYFEVHKEDFLVKDNAPKKIVMSPKCDIEVQSLGKGIFEVKLIGEGKLVKRVKQGLPSGEYLVLGGDDKNDNAWFVVIGYP